MNSFPLFGRRISTAALLGFLTFAVTAAAYFWPTGTEGKGPTPPPPTPTPQVDPVWVRIEKNGTPALDVEVMDAAGRVLTPNQKGMISFSPAEAGKVFTVIDSNGVEILTFVLAPKGNAYQRIALP